MPLISTKLHGAGDYATGALLLGAPKVLAFAERRATLLLQATGAATLTGSAFTDYEFGISRQISMPVHLINDASSGLALFAATWGLRRRGAGLGSWLPVAVVGAGQIAGAALTERQPGDRGPSGPPGVPVEAPAEAPGAGIPPSPPVAAATSNGDPIRTAPGIADDAGTPDDTATADDTAGPDDEVFVAEQEAAAAAEAASIGGRVTPETSDPAMEPVYEAGGGEDEGFEIAEEELIENASHGDGGGSPARDAITPEAETDRSTAVYGEGDVERSSETGDDAEAGPAPERG